MAQLSKNDFPSKKHVYEKRKGIIFLKETLEEKRDQYEKFDSAQMTNKRYDLDNDEDDEDDLATLVPDSDYKNAREDIGYEYSTDHKLQQRENAYESLANIVKHLGFVIEMADNNIDVRVAIKHPGVIVATPPFEDKKKFNPENMVHLDTDNQLFFWADPSRSEKYERNTPRDISNYKNDKLRDYVDKAINNTPGDDELHGLLKDMVSYITNNVSKAQEITR
jgi:hypothetical protein